MSTDSATGTDLPSTRVLDPSILYVGTPVALVSSRSAADEVNLMPMSSSFFLGRTGMLGLGTRSRTAQNLAETRECVVNLASDDLVSHVDRLALTTGRDPVPDGKADVGYVHIADKFGHAGLTALPSDLVAPPRVAECPIALEARVTAIRPLEEDDPSRAGDAIAFELRVVRVHVHDAVRLEGYEHRIDPARWRPLLQSFQRFFAIGEEVHPSRLATVDEDWYR